MSSNIADIWKLNQTKILFLHLHKIKFPSISDPLIEKRSVSLACSCSTARSSWSQNHRVAALRCH